jgi:nitrate reductase (NAD(P)H)
LRDAEDPTECLVLNGNRAEEDILCKAELDALAEANPGRCRIIHALTKPPSSWTGVTGRLSQALYEKEVGRPASNDTGDELVLVCGPGPMEKSAREIFSSMGWKEDDLIFF